MPTPTMPRSRVARRAAGVLAAATLLLGAGAARASAAQVVSYGSVDRLVQSTGNLYWTAHDFDGQHNELSVWRTAKTAGPGDETQLWEENAGANDSFGALTYANVAGNWYGYFVANYLQPVVLGGPVQRVSVIKRVPLAGGPAVALRTTNSPLFAFDQLPGAVGQDDLVTDGSYLYWADSQAVRRMPIGGGSVSTLASGIALGHVALDDGYVYYTSGTTMRRVPKAGGASTILQESAYTITALAVVPGSPTIIYWAFTQRDGKADVESKALGGGAPQLRYQSYAPASTTTISVTGDNRVFFSACDADRCDLDWDDPGIYPEPVHIVAADYPGAHDVQGDANDMYWADGYGILRAAL